jgi:hypothetical protein
MISHPVASEIAREHGGRIEVAPSEEETRFTLHSPPRYSTGRRRNLHLPDAGLVNDVMGLTDA